MNRLEAIWKRAEVATKGPWGHDTQPFDEGPDVVWAESEGEVCTMQGGGGQDFYNAAFIAHAREDIPALLRAVLAMVHFVAIAERSNVSEDDYFMISPELINDLREAWAPLLKEEG